MGGCERVFSSPVPPTMSRHRPPLRCHHARRPRPFRPPSCRSRHVIRCMLLWLLGLPAVLAGSMSPAHISLWVFLVSYIFVGIEEVGVQVEHRADASPERSRDQPRSAEISRGERR